MSKLFWIRANLNIANEGGETGFIIACQIGHLAIMNEFLMRGADVAVTDKIHWTGSIHACNKGHFEIVKALLASGISVNVGHTRLAHSGSILAAIWGDIDMVLLLLTSCSDFGAMSVVHLLVVMAMLTLCYCLSNTELTFTAIDIFMMNIV